MNRILFVNHREKACGVGQFGKRIFAPAMKSTRYECFYIDIDHEHEFDHWSGVLAPQIVVYNYYSAATMPWLTREKLQRQREKYIQLSIFHEVDIWNMGFDGLIHQDPTNDDTRYYKMSRSIPEYKPVKWECEIPVISSFGFGLGGKGFTTVVNRVKSEFDRAIIRINIAFANFGDKNGTSARSWAADCYKLLADSPNIKLKITHDMMEENDLLDWLAMSSVNAFLYDYNYGRGIGSTLDYALAAGKPIAITKSWQFKHFWSIDEHALVENQSLHDIIAQGTQYLQTYHDMWGDTAVLRDFEAIFDKFLGN